ncbi:hypothetical protein GIS00_13615 [Nakamurella sp. YIM 132087]|uniref:Uncharacterized protein n=1 Tax=Nakamurella alba TaxID=2665158 RepID=A0A7K1FLF2_9ACTN|nr:hypothetical protein [Nakamurella alba]MTD14977.1 hypothetical protein [Nakamurella alba]
MSWSGPPGDSGADPRSGWGAPPGGAQSPSGTPSGAPAGPGSWGAPRSSPGTGGWGQGGTSAGFGSSGGSGWGGAPGSATPAAPPGWAAGSPAPAGSGDPGTATRPPLGLLWAAIAGPMIGAVLLVLSGWGWNVAGWALAVVGGLGMLVVFTSIDLRRRASPWYLARPGSVAGLRLAVAAAAIVVAGVHAYLLADFVARLDVWA